MSKTEMISERTNKPETKEIYAVYRQNLSRYFDEIKKDSSLFSYNFPFILAIFT